MIKRAKTLTIWIVLILLFVGVYALEQRSQEMGFQDFDTFLADVEQDRVESIRVDSNEIYVTLADSQGKYRTLGLVEDELTKTISEHGIALAWGKPARPLRSLLLVGFLLVCLLALFWYFARKSVRMGSNNPFTLGKTTARLLDKSTGVSFADVGGCATEKEQLEDVIDFLRNPERWLASGVRLPRGVLLDGPPGCGKTLLARAVAGETNANFFCICASEFVEMFVGIGAARVRDTFDSAAKQIPAVIFIDELDAVGRSRGSGMGLWNEEREQTLNQLLVCMDGFERNDQIVVIAATNRADVLDKALLRPGRFDLRIVVPEPGIEDRLEILKIHTANKPLADDVSLREIAEQSAGMNGAELECLANEAAWLAVRRGRNQDDTLGIMADDFRRALTDRRKAENSFDALDTLLIESALRMAEPTGKAVVKVRQNDGSVVEGEALWADAAFVKIRTRDDDELVIAKSQISQVQRQLGTEAAGRELAGIAALDTMQPELAAY